MQSVDEELHVAKTFAHKNRFQAIAARKNDSVVDAAVDLRDDCEMDTFYSKIPDYERWSDEQLRQSAEEGPDTAESFREGDISQSMQ